jgi:hypothetical protein
MIDTSYKYSTRYTAVRLCACPADAEFKAAIRSVSDECSTNIDMHKQFVDKYEAKLIQAKADLQLRQRQFEQYKMRLNDTESSYVERVAAMDIVAANQQPTMSQRMTRRWGHDIGPVEPHAGPPNAGPLHAGPLPLGPPHLGPHGPHHRRRGKDWLGGWWGGGTR